MQPATDYSDPQDLADHLLGAMVRLRVGLAVVGFLFPFALSIGGKLYAHLCLQSSMSSYYHAIVYDCRSMRDWFVGSLCVIGVFLYLYRGFSHLENWALNIAGGLAVVVALFPMPWTLSSLITCEGQSVTGACSPQPYDPVTIGKYPLHDIAAIGFFLCISYVAIFRAQDTLPLIHNPRLRTMLKHIYRWIGIAMIVSVLGAFIIHSYYQPEYRTFYIETAGVLSFSAYWAVKTWELSKTDIDRRGVQKQLRQRDTWIVPLDESRTVTQP